jgi:hypothetical protein
MSLTSHADGERLPLDRLGYSRQPMTVSSLFRKSLSASTDANSQYGVTGTDALIVD